MRSSIKKTYVPLSNAMKNYTGNTDNFNNFYYIISQGSKNLINDNSILLEQMEKENLDKNKLQFASSTKKKSKFVMHFLRRQFFIFHVHLFEYFLLNLIREIHSTNKNTLKSCNKSINIKDILEARDKERLDELLIDAKMEGLGKGSYDEILKYFENNFKINLAKSGISDQKIVERFQLRHVIVHNNGIVDRQFKNKNTNKKYHEGKKVYIGQDYLEKTQRDFMCVARHLDTGCFEKFKFK